MREPPAIELLMFNGELPVAYVRKTDYDALAARLAEAERLLDSGVIRLIQRDEFGQVGFHLIKGIDLRQCIAEAIESERPAVSATGVPE